MQLTVEQRTFFVKKIFETGSLEVTCRRFAERFPERRPPALNLKRSPLIKTRGIQKDTGRSEANIVAVRVRLTEHPTGTSARRNSVCLNSATHNVRAHAVARQPPEFDYEVNISHEKLTVWIKLCGNGKIIGPLIFFFERNVPG